MTSDQKRPPSSEVKQQGNKRAKENSSEVITGDVSPSPEVEQQENKNRSEVITGDMSQVVSNKRRLALQEDAKKYIKWMYEEMNLAETFERMSDKTKKRVDYNPYHSFDIDPLTVDPDKPAPEGYAWASSMPNSNRRSFLAKLICVDCGLSGRNTNHSTGSLDCPNRDTGMFSSLSGSRSGSR